LILEFTFSDGSTVIERIPAEVWQHNNYNISKIFFFEKELVSVTLDPFVETADVDLNNNSWPRKIVPSKFQLYKMSDYYSGEGENPMQRQKREEN